MHDEMIDMKGPPAEAQSSPLYTEVPPKLSRRLPFILLYAASVLSISAAARLGCEWPIDWSVFRWSPLTMYPVLHDLQQWLHLPNAMTQWLVTPSIQSLDAFAFVTFFLIPLTAVLLRIDKAAFGLRRWARRDKYWPLGIALLGGIALFALQQFPAQAAIVQQSLQRIGPDGATTFGARLLWIGSWILGWEFMMRYVVLNALHREWPKWGWRWIPLVEGLYYLQASAPEAIARCLLAIFLTRRVLKRRNLLVALVAHAIIEVELAAFLLYR